MSRGWAVVAVAAVAIAMATPAVLVGQRIEANRDRATRQFAMVELGQSEREVTRITEPPRERADPGR